MFFKGDLIYLILITFISSLFIIVPAQAKKITKKNSQYTGKALVDYETMFNAGTWFMILNKCEGTFAKDYKYRLASLSWEDFKIFNSGHAKYSGGDYLVSKCDKKENKEIIEWYNEIINYIENQLNINNEINENQVTENKNQKTIKDKLLQLKKLFEDDLITQDEYDAKRKEILDEM